MNFFQNIVTFLRDVAAALAATSSPFEAGVILMINGGWILALGYLLAVGVIQWQYYRQDQYEIENRKFILLALDVPRDNEQTPKAVENIFAHLHGILPGKNNLYEEWILGKTVDYFSMELVSVEGYVQFLIFTQEEYRDLVESAIYAQYPNAEITEVEDYVDGPDGDFKSLRFPNDTYDIFGTEYILAKGTPYPIRSHIEFEHSLSQEFKDSMASLLENMNKIGPGEQIWLQWVITPEYDDRWQPDANNEALKIAGKKVKEKRGFVDKIVDVFVGGLDNLGVWFFPFYPKSEESAAKEERDLPSLMLHLTPSEQQQVDQIQKKADKIGFWSKFRFVYIARKEVFSKPRGVATIQGSVKQLNSINLNSLTMHKWTKTSGIDYWLVDWRMNRRKNAILRAYQGRSRSMGSSGQVFNIEELATMYHFPTIYVKAPLVSRTEAKRASAPVTLPLEHQAARLRAVSVKQPPKEVESDHQEAPAQIEVSTNSGDSAAAQRPPHGVPPNLPFV